MNAADVALVSVIGLNPGNTAWLDPQAGVNPEVRVTVYPVGAIPPLHFTFTVVGAAWPESSALGVTVADTDRDVA